MRALAHGCLYGDNALLSLAFEGILGAAVPRVPTELIRMMQKSPMPDYLERVKPGRATSLSATNARNDIARRYM